jgi:hypothetical protein
MCSGLEWEREKVQEKKREAMANRGKELSLARDLELVAILTCNSDGFTGKINSLHEPGHPEWERIIGDP